MFGVPAAELAQLQVEQAWDRELLQPVVAPGTRAEAEAIELLDQRRAEDLARLGDTSFERARRTRRYWGNHYRHART